MGVCRHGKGMDRYCYNCAAEGQEARQDRNTRMPVNLSYLQVLRAADKFAVTEKISRENRGE